MKKKRIISILLASAICVTFIGCGKKNDSSNVPDIKNNVTSSDKKNGNTDSGDDSAKSLKTLYASSTIFLPFHLLFILSNLSILAYWYKYSVAIATLKI